MTPLDKKVQNFGTAKDFYLYNKILMPVVGIGNLLLLLLLLLLLSLLLLYIKVLINQ